MTQTTTTAAPGTEELAALIGIGGQGRRRGRHARRVIIALVLVAAAIGGLMAFRLGGAEPQLTYQKETVTRGTLSVTVSATGNLKPTNEVDVGSELSGLVDAVLVQENDRVKTGQVVARLDTSKLKDAITEVQASLASAEAKQRDAEATLAESTANLDRLREVSTLSGGKVPSRTEMETAEATLKRSQASVSSAVAAVNQARATLSTNQINLSKASIRSPIDGVVLSRKVEPGQTVAASLQVATLFTIAEDLRNMELQVAVDEADVGKVKEGQRATFTVDAYPNRKYVADVIRVAYGSTTSNNVVSYTTTLRVKNEDLSLRPGMTATAEIACITRERALLVPNAALRFTPAAASTQQSTSLIRSLMPGPPRDDANSRQAKSKTAAQQVWMLRDGRPIAVALTVGETDGRFTEVTGGDLKEGAAVITDATAIGGSK
jgi:HlyD family secretion protein